MAQSDSRFKDGKYGENLFEVNGKFHLIFFNFSTLITKKTKQKLNKEVNKVNKEKNKNSTKKIRVK